MTDIDTSQGDDLSRFCGAIGRQTGKPCRRPAGWGTDHVGVGPCKLHLGSTRNHRKRWGAILNERRVRNELGAMLDELEADGAERDPLEVLAEQLARAQAMVVALGTLVGELPLGDGAAAVTSGLHGPDHNDDGRPHVLVVMYGDWIDRAGRLAKLAKDVGLQERRTQVTEDLAAMVHVAMVAALQRQAAMFREGVDPTEIEREVPALIASVLESTAREAS